MVRKILEIKNLKKHYDSGFDLGVDHLGLDENRIMVLIGPNGSGKSTLIKLINLLEQPDSDGSNVLYSGKAACDLRKNMSAVFQDPFLFNMSVYNNIIIGLKLRHIKVGQKKEIFDYLIEKLNIEHLLLRNPGSLSGGEQQRVALARALVLEPRLLLLDEPLANIDQLSREDLRSDLFGILKDTERSAIYVTHDRNEAMIIADDIAVINSGKIEQTGPKNDVFRRPSNEFVAKFVGVETLLEGTVLENKNNVCSVGINRTEIYAVSDFRTGQNVTVAIRPEDVVLFSEGTDLSGSSALNFFRGTVIELQDVGLFKKVELDCGFRLVSFVTANSVDRLGLQKGKVVNSSVKASSIHLLKR
ncbi:MAG: ABC transporter ATP-binding protein [Actinobacteria bacterium]|nr:ABC transporter ATP-binding protein [Actinomycetota bacterium]